jgi:large subunit ribosomal protein L9
VKLILTADVPHLGEKGTSVQVKDGYARNFLLPKKLAEPWSAQAESKLAEIQQRKDRQSQAAQVQASELIRSLDQLQLKFFKKITAKGNLYGSVKVDEIAQAIQQQTGISVSSQQIVLDAPIKQLGESSVEIQFENQQVAMVKVLVSSITAAQQSS